MSFVDSFERKGLFNLVRLLALTIIFVLLLGMATGGFFILKEWKDRPTSYINKALVINLVRLDPSLADNSQLQSNSTESDQNLSPEIKIPFALQKYFSTPTNREILLKNLERIPEENHQDYFSNMLEVITAGEEQGLARDKVLNTYIEMKEKALSELRFREPKETLMFMYISGAYLSGLVLVALFSLILVQLAIERNTRHVKQNNVEIKRNEPYL